MLRNIIMVDYIQRSNYKKKLHELVIYFYIIELNNLENT